MPILPKGGIRSAGVICAVQGELGEIYMAVLEDYGEPEVLQTFVTVITKSAGCAAPSSCTDPLPSGIPAVQSEAGFPHEVK